MKKKLILFFLTTVVLSIGYLIVQSIVKSKISTFLEQQVAKGNFTYKRTDFNFLRGNLKLSEVHFSKNDYNIASEEVEIFNFSYFKYLIHKDISVKKIKIINPIITIQKKGTTQHSISENYENLPDIDIKKIEIEQGSVSVLKDSSEIFYIENFTANIQEIAVDLAVLKEKIPFRHKEFDLEIKLLSYELNQLHTLSANRISLSQKNLSVRKLQLIPKYTKQNYIEVMHVEEDLMNLTIDSLDIPEYHLSFSQDVPLFESPKIKITGADFDVYRDKTVADDPTTKDLYSKMLRELPIKLKINNIKISDATIQYQELIKKDRQPGKVLFTNIDANIAQVTNVALERQDFPETTVIIDSDFMEESPLRVEWRFKINDTNDFFTIKGSSHSIPQEAINSFFIPAFNMKTEGFINDIYFNYSGNRETASGDFMIKYDNFIIEVLKEDRREEAGVLSWIANIFVKKSSKGNEITKHVDEVKRDETKSFWNYFWNCIQSGLVKVLI